MGQLVSLEDWASGPNGFKQPPSRASLHRIAKTGQTIARALKQSRRWVIDEEAKFIGLLASPVLPPRMPKAVKTLIERVINGSQTT
ncbi:TPA: excisionase [Enterobacter hormaechei]